MPETEITSYSTEDLLRIMGLTNPTIAEVQSAAETLAVRMERAGKPHLALFFRQAEEKILNELEDSDDSDNEQADPTTQLGQWWEDQFLRQEDPQQTSKITDRRQKIGIFNDSQDTMKRQRLGVANVASIPVAQGTINPTLRNITTRTVLIDSQFRQNIDATGAEAESSSTTSSGANTSSVYKSTDYSIDLSESLKNVLSMTLYQVQIPVTWYAFSCAFGNVTYSINEQKCTRTISEGNYSLEDILSGKMIGRAYSDAIVFPDEYTDAARAKKVDQVRKALVPCGQGPCSSQCEGTNPDPDCPDECKFDPSGNELNGKVPIASLPAIANRASNDLCIGTRYYVDPTLDTTSCSKDCPSDQSPVFNTSTANARPWDPDNSDNKNPKIQCGQSNLHRLCFNLGGVNNNRLVNPGPDTYVFFRPRAGLSDSGVCGACPPNPFINQNLGWSLGFRPNKSGIIQAIPGVPATAAPDLFGPKYFVVALDDYNNNRLNQGIISTVGAQQNTKMPSYAVASDKTKTFAGTVTQVDNINPPPPGQKKQVCRYVKGDPRRYTIKQLYELNEILKTREPGGIFGGLAAKRAEGPTESDSLGIVPLDGNEITSLRTAGLLNPSTNLSGIQISVSMPNDPDNGDTTPTVSTNTPTPSFFKESTLLGGGAPYTKFGNHG